MKDASSTDVVVHRGDGAHELLPVRRPVPPRPATPATRSARRTWSGAFPFDWGVSAHPKVDDAHRRAAVLQLRQGGAVHALRRRRRRTTSSCTTSTSPLPGPRLPHDMAFTENYAILNDFPLFWDPKLLQRRRPPAAVPPRHADAVRASSRAAADRRHPVVRGRPDYVLHWINAYEDGDEIVLDGFFQGDPSPADTRTGDKYAAARSGSSPSTGMQTRLHRWRFNLVTGAGDARSSCRTPITEFGMINGGYAGRQVPLHLRRDGQAGLVPVRRPGQARPADRRRGALRLRRRRVRQRDARWRRASAAPPRTTATSSR